MLQVLKQVIALFFHYIMLGVLLPSFPPFWIGIYKHICKRIHYSLDCPPNFISCLCISFASLFILPNFFNPQFPNLECVNIAKAGP